MLYKIIRNGWIKIDSEIKTKIIGSIEKNKKEIISFLQKLIQINSETGKELQIQKFISR